MVTSSNYRINCSTPVSSAPGLTVPGGCSLVRNGRLVSLCPAGDLLQKGLHWLMSPLSSCVLLLFGLAEPIFVFFIFQGFFSKTFRSFRDSLFVRRNACLNVIYSDCKIICNPALKQHSIMLLSDFEIIGPHQATPNSQTLTICCCQISRSSCSGQPRACSLRKIQSLLYAFLHIYSVFEIDFKSECTI